MKRRKFLKSSITGIICIGALHTFATEDSTGQDSEVSVSWDVLPPLPNDLGLGGPFVGVSNGALLIAGGANFPEGFPWEGGAKHWYDQVYILESDSDGTYRWNTDSQLPGSLAYGVTVQTESGVILIGGQNANSVYKEVYRVEWLPGPQELRIETLPSLPRPVCFSTAARIANDVFVFGGQDSGNPDQVLHSVYHLNLSDLQSGWSQVERWPGPPLRKALVIAQQEENREYLYLISGQTLEDNSSGEKNVRFLTDCYRYDPRRESWKSIADIPHPMCAAPGLAIGDSKILVLGGSAGRHVGKNLKRHHPGFSKDILAYDTVLDKWSKIGEMPTAVVTTTAVHWQHKPVVPTGEIKPGIRTPNILQGTVAV